MTTPRGRREGITGGRDRAYGRLSGSSQELWVWKATDDPSMNVITSRSRLDVPRGQDLKKIINHDLPVMRSSAGCWPASIPLTAEEEAMEREWESVRVEHVRRYGFPNSPKTLGDGEEREDVQSFLSSSESTSESDFFSRDSEQECGMQRSDDDIQGESSKHVNKQQHVTDSLGTGPDVRPSKLPPNRHLYSTEYNSVVEMEGEDDGDFDTSTLGDRSNRSHANDAAGDRWAEQLHLAMLQERALQYDSQRPRKQLTFSLQPKAGPRFNPATAPRWEPRHHMTVSSHNTQLHEAHRDFFDRPQAVDMLTKARRVPGPEPIVERIRPLPYDECMGTLIFKKGTPSSALDGGKRILSKMPIRSTVDPRIGSMYQRRAASNVLYHSESFLEPLALAKRTTGNALYVPASLSL